MTSDWAAEAHYAGMGTTVSLCFFLVYSDRSIALYDLRMGSPLRKLITANAHKLHLLESRRPSTLQRYAKCHAHNCTVLYLTTTYYSVPYCTVLPCTTR